MEENQKKWEEVKKTAVAEADTQNATGPKPSLTRLTDEDIRLLRTEESRKRLQELEKAIVAQARTYDVNAMSPKPFEKKLTYEENRLKRREENIQRWEAMKKALLTQAKAEIAPNATGPEFSPKTDDEIRLKRTEEDKKGWEEMKNTMLVQAETQNAPNATSPQFSPKKLTYEEIQLKRTEENKKRLEEMKKTMFAQAETQNAPNATSPKPSPKKLTYEEIQLKRTEENKMRLEEMKKPMLAQAETQNAPNATSPKPSLVKVSQEVDLSAVRRPDQVVDKTSPHNKEIVIEPLGQPNSYKRKDLLNRVYAADEDRQYAKERAVQLQSEFSADFPSFVKPMLQSHVTGGFWLGLPVHFCKTHLPKHDEYVTLVDENGDEFKTKYLASKTGLSGGWRRFATDHRLVDGDALVFQLVAPTRFKVYIIRVKQAEDQETKGIEICAPEMNQVKSNHPRKAERALGIRQVIF